MKKIFYTLLVSLTFATTAMAQNISVSGTVKSSAEGLPLIGVNIIVKNTSSGAVSDFDGNFTISNVQPNATLVFTYVGFETLELPAASVMNVDLEEDNESLDEIVLIGYGSKSRKDLTGSVSIVGSETIEKLKPVDVSQALQGTTAGVSVSTQSGSPGSYFRFLIRGVSSNTDNDPLLVVDGYIVSSFNSLNPDDIESLTVLKDAQAAIYGVEGANGVILVTTKKGKNGKVKVSAFLTSSVRSINNKYNVLDGFGYANYVNEIRENNGDANPRYLVDGPNIYSIANGIQSTDPVEIYNWQDEVYINGVSQKFGASASGGSDNGNYYISTGFDNQEGVVQNSSFKSSDIRINLNQKLNDNLQLKARMSGFLSTNDFVQGGDLIGNSNRSFVNQAVAFRPLLANDDIPEEQFQTNPYAWTNDFTDFSRASRYIGSLSLTYKLPVKGLSYEAKFGGNIRNKDRRRWFGLTTFQGNDTGGQLTISKLNTKSYQFNNLIRFNRRFNRKHRINAVFGLTYDVRKVATSTYGVEDFITTQFSIEQPAFGQVIRRPLTLFKSDQQIFSILGRLNYTYDNKYILTATIRRDGVSKFSDGNKYGVFPSFALAWNAGNESFVQNLDLFESLKFRAGWGQIGNHGIGPYGTISNYGVLTSLYGNADGGTNVPIALLGLSNPDLTWETTEQLNFGFDFSSLNDVVSGTVDIYNKTTKDLLQNSNIPPSSGFLNILVNKGSISNKGIEAALNFTPISTDDMELSFGGNISFNKTEITDLNSQPLQDFYENGAVSNRRFYYGNAISRGQYFKSFANVFVEGEESSLFYGYETDGIYQNQEQIDNADVVQPGAQPGDLIYVDQNGDGVINFNDDSDKKEIGSPIPDFTFGLNLNATYKNFDVSANIFSAIGQEIIRNYERLQPYANQQAYVIDRWVGDGSSEEVPRVTSESNRNSEFSDYYVESGNFVRLRNIQLGYTFDSKFIKKIKMRSIRVYGSVNNVITLTRYRGYDPEFGSSGGALSAGVDYGFYPQARTFMLGTNFRF